MYLSLMFGCSLYYSIIDGRKLYELGMLVTQGVGSNSSSIPLDVEEHELLPTPSSTYTQHPTHILPPSNKLKKKII